MRAPAPDAALPVAPIAVMRSCYGEKFGAPRQPGLAPSAFGHIEFFPAYANPDALRGLEGFSHLWIIFRFHLAEGWSPTVRPPRLGGNERVGVFASRSPFRPNPFGLSVVKLEKIDYDTPAGPIIRVSGLDLVDGTPILDIKPYVAYSDALPHATGGFAPSAPAPALEVVFAPGLAEKLPAALRAVVTETLALDPRPAFHDDPEREYGVALAGRNVRFRVADGRATVTGVSDL